MTEGNAGLQAGTARLRRANAYPLHGGRRDGVGSVIGPAGGTWLRPCGPRAGLEAGVPSRSRRFRDGRGVRQDAPMGNPPRHPHANRA